MSFLSRFTAFLSLALLIGNVRASPEDDDAESEEMGSIQVTATRTGNLVRDEPIRVEVVPQEEIEENLTIQPGNLSTLLNELGGVHIQSSAPALGGATLQMRGLPGRHTLVLQDGLLLLGNQTDAFGLLQIPPLDLARVEVIKGVGSALYGPSALGGVLNLVSSQPDSEPQILLNRSSRGGTDALAFVSARATPTLGYTITTGAHDQTREDIDGDAWADIAAYRRYTFRPRLFWKNGDQRSVFATLGYVDEEREGGSMPGRTLADGTTFRDALNSRRFDGGLVTQQKLAGDRELSTRWSATGLTRDRTFGAQQVHDAQTSANAEGTLSGTDQGHQWLLGLALQLDRLESEDAPTAGHSYFVPALFVQDEYTPVESVTLAASARVDVHSDFGTFVSPRLSILFRPQEEWSVRASFGTGFAAPTAVMDETEATSLATLLPLHNLHAERALSSSLDVKWRDEGWEINGSVFASEIRDPLTVRSSSLPDRLELFNAGGPRRAVGAELLLHYVTGALQVIGSSTYLDVTEAAEEGGRQRADRVPRVSAELAGILEDEDRGRVGIEISYTGRQQLLGNPYRDEGRSYVEINALAEMKFGSVAVFFNAVDLSDVRQTHFDPLLRPTPAVDGERIVDVWAPLAGRTFNLGIRMEL
ncbi:MAG TPA: TonB-dependent receptor [Steroidobacteraceae bacterium]|jgi:iron complex outermembrane receptor protein|nr:TonB-dependent receptor [Steroidobacteraceae bacterium]